MRPSRFDGPSLTVFLFVLKTIEPDKIRRLLIRCPNWIGDAVMATPALGDIRAFFPRARISVAANPIVAELFSPHPYCDEVVVYDRQGTHCGVNGMFRFAGTLRRENFDLAILLQNAFQSAILAFLAKVPLRAGYTTDGRGVLLTHGVPVPETARSRHQITYYRQMLNSLGIGGGDGVPRLQSTQGEIDRVGKLLERGPWIALNPGAAYGPAKRWSPERFAETADRLRREFAARVVLIGGPQEMAIGRDVEAAAACSLLNMIGRTTVREMMAILACCRLVVTNDSGPMHVAAALGVPIVALFGPTEPTVTAPFTKSCRIVRRSVDCAPCRYRACPTDHRCMTAIEADDVVTAAKDLLGGGG